MKMTTCFRLKKKSALLFLLSECACGKARTVTTPLAPGVFDELGWTGQWDTDCAAEAGGSVRRSLAFQGSSFIVREVSFAREGCLPQDELAVMVAKFGKAGEVEPDMPGWNTIRHEVQSVTLTARSQECARRFSAAGRYGISNWIVGVPNEVGGSAADADSEPEPRVGDIHFRTWRLRGDVLESAVYRGGVALWAESVATVFRRAHGA